jgi:hypothetical protein
MGAGGGEYLIRVQGLEVGAHCEVGAAERRREYIHVGLSAASMPLTLSSAPTPHHTPRSQRYSLDEITRATEH